MPEIRAEGLGRSFGSKVVLRGVDLEIGRGELVAVVGGSGAGKSVLLDLMVGLLPPSEGRVLIADHSTAGAPLRDLAELNEDELDRLRRHWSVVFQRNALYSGGVYDNVALWLRQNTERSEGEIRTIVLESLRAVGFEAPEEVSRKERSELSGGMAKRVAIARAIAMDPELIFYDEPTSGLDPRLSAQVHGLISSTHERCGALRTSVIITHDKDLLARLRPRVVMLHDGGVYFDGTFAEFAASGSEVIRPYFELMPALQALSPRARGST